jgi:nitroimidazol reductase NimA-like FMN-containing flavoprotein (pyridoxamine 5'-phosphate oxidase superfamily)
MANERWRVLTEVECRALLAQRHLGRIAVVENDRPLIFPVNYIVDDTHVVFRTDQGTKLDVAARGGPVAFEVDGIDEAQRTGWSVLLHGHAELVTNPLDLDRLRRQPLVPWAPGAKPHYVRLRAAQLTGRRIIVADLPSNWWG